MALTPKGCVVRMIELDGNGRAEVRLGCAGPGITDPVSYSSKFVKARRLSFRGVTVTGKAQASFVVSPAVASCKQSGDQITCTLRGDTSGGSLRGARRKRRRR